MFYDSEEFDLFKIKHNDIAPRKGKVLLSMPFMHETHFKKSVIILTEHNNDGTFGFILNKEADYYLSDVLTDVPENDIMVSYGGPVESDTLHFVHTLGNAIPDTVQVQKGLYWGGELEVMKQLIARGEATREQVRFFVGYAGWEPNQLFDEIYSDSWLVSSLSPLDIMRKSDVSLWKSAMSKLGKKYSYWTNFPDNPNLN